MTTMTSRMCRISSTTSLSVLPLSITPSARPGMGRSLLVKGSVLGGNRVKGLKQIKPWTELRCESNSSDVATEEETVANGDKPTVKIDNQSDTFATVVTMRFGNKIPHPLDTMAVLRNLGLHIVRARIDSSDPDSKNRFYVTDAETSEKIVKSARLEEIRLTVLENLMKLCPETTDQLNSAHRIKLPETRDPTAPLGPRKRIVVDTNITIKESATGCFSELYIETKDRTGLLVDVVSTLKSLNVNVISAEVDTIGTQSEQEFFVTYHGQPLNASMKETVTNCLQYYLSLAEVERDESY